MPCRCLEIVTFSENIIWGWVWIICILKVQVYVVWEPLLYKKYFSNCLEKFCYKNPLFLLLFWSQIKSVWILPRSPDVLNDVFCFLSVLPGNCHESTSIRSTAYFLVHLSSSHSMLHSPATDIFKQPMEKELIHTVYGFSRSNMIVATSAHFSIVPSTSDSLCVCEWVQLWGLYKSISV
jgi:hypothetical protein